MKEGEKTEIMAKNRYKNILTFRDTRVILRSASISLQQEGEKARPKTDALTSYHFTIPFRFLCFSFLEMFFVPTSVVEPNLAFQEKTAKNIFFFLFLSKIAIYLFLGLQKGRSSYRRSLQP
jgi:hypothetical protein